MISIIMPAYNGLQYTVQAVEALLRKEEGFELIIVDNGSTDGTSEYADGMSRRHNNIHVIHFMENKGVPAALNAGMKEARGDYIVWMNNDIIISPRAISRMITHMDRAEEETKLSPVGMIGPMMNFVAGRQFDPGGWIDPARVDDYAAQVAREHPDTFWNTGWLCGSCLVMKREVYEKVGEVDERFFPGGYEDNDYCLRAILAGYKLIIDRSTFVYHYGSRTFNLEELFNTKWGIKHMDTFIRKWYRPREQRLIAAYRVKNGGELFRRSLEATSQFADGIVVLDDGSEDDTAEIARSCPKTLEVRTYHRPFDERRDRNEIIQMAADHGADWIFVIDHDEIVEAKFTREYAQRLMNPPDPQILAYQFHFYNFFMGETHWRSDGIFGRMRGPRLFRVFPNQEIVGGNEIGLHCGNIPPIPQECIAPSAVRIKHLGFITEEMRRRKYEFYEEIDQDRDIKGIGAEDYYHIISPKIELTRWKEQNSIGFYCLTGDETLDLIRILDRVWPITDEMAVLHTGTSPEVEEICRMFGAHYKHMPFRDDFSQLRNAAKAMLHTDWILTLDTDEDIPNDAREAIRKLVEEDVHGYMFQVTNYHKEGEPSFSESIRLYRNLPILTYRGLVHENFDDAIRDHRLRIAYFPWKLDHFGYLKPQEKFKAKLKLYEKLNEKQIQQQPEDPKARFNLALHKLNDGDIDAAVDLLLEAANLDPAYWHPQMQLGMVFLRAAQRWFRNTLEAINPNHPLKEEIEILLATITSMIGEEERRL